MSAEDAAELEAEVTQINARAPLESTDNPMEARYQRCWGLQRKINRGVPLAEGEKRFFEAYNGSDEWRAMERQAEDWPWLRGTEGEDDNDQESAAGS